MVRSVWRILGSINLTIGLLLGIALNLAVGSRFAKYLPKIYGQLNHLRFQEWLTGNGTGYSWWVWSLFFLLFLFGVNTFACTVDRLFELLKKRSDYSFGAFSVVVAPSVMHLCFLVIIGGHAVSQFTSEIRQMPVTSGARLALSSVNVTVLGSRCSYRSEPALAGQVRDCRVSLSLSSPSGEINREITMLHPILRDGYTLTLTMAGKPAAYEAPAMMLIVKRDPGLPMILFGNALLCLLMLWYFPIILRKKMEGNGRCH
jgi:hypothetical protein